MKRPLSVSLDDSHLEATTPTNPDPPKAPNNDDVQTESPQADSTSLTSLLTSPLSTSTPIKDAHEYRDPKPISMPEESTEIKLEGLGLPPPKRRLPPRKAKEKNRRYEKDDPDRPLNTQDELGLAKRWLVAQERAVDGMLQAQEDWDLVIQHQEGTEAYETAITTFLTKHNQYASSPSSLPPRLTKWAIKYIRMLNNGERIDLGDSAICPPRCVRGFSDHDHWAGSYACDAEGVPLPPVSGEQRADNLVRVLEERERAFKENRTASKRPCQCSHRPISMPPLLPDEAASNANPLSHHRGKFPGSQSSASRIIEPDQAPYPYGPSSPLYIPPSPAFGPDSPQYTPASPIYTLASPPSASASQLSVPLSPIQKPASRAPTLPRLSLDRASTSQPMPSAVDDLPFLDLDAQETAVVKGREKTRNRLDKQKILVPKLVRWPDIFLAPWERAMRNWTKAYKFGFATIKQWVNLDHQLAAGHNDSATLQAASLMFAHYLQSCDLLADISRARLTYVYTGAYFIMPPYHLLQSTMQDRLLIERRGKHGAVATVGAHKMPNQADRNLIRAREWRYRLEATLTVLREILTAHIRQYGGTVIDHQDQLPFPRQGLTIIILDEVRFLPDEQKDLLKDAAQTVELRGIHSFIMSKRRPITQASGGGPSRGIARVQGGLGGAAPAEGQGKAQHGSHGSVQQHAGIGEMAAGQVAESLGDTVEGRGEGYQEML